MSKPTSTANEVEPTVGPWVQVSVGVTALVVVAFVAVTLFGREAACTLMGGSSWVGVNSTQLFIAEPTTTEVCLDDQCIPLNWSELMNGEVGNQTVFAINGDHRERTLVVRTHDGVNIVGPETVELERFYPNGKGCAPELLGGQFVIQPDGSIERLAIET